MKHDNFTSWIIVATGRILYGPDRIAVAAELRAHLEDHRDGLIAKGMDEESATKEALSSMGSAEGIAPQLAAVHRPFWGFFLRTSQILLIILLCLSILPILNYFRDLDLDHDISYQDFDVFDAAYYGGDTGRTLLHLSQPNISFSSDGSTFTLTDAAVFTEYMSYYQQDVAKLYFQIRQDTLLPWTEHKEYYDMVPVTGYFSARDSLGNEYPGFFEGYGSDDPYISSGGAQTGIFSYTHECWILFFDGNAEWVDICYEQDGRSHALRIHLTGGDAE